MNSAFAITAAATSIQLDSSRTGGASFTVTNTTGRPVRARLRPVPLGATNAAWLSLAGEGERQLAVNGTATVEIRIQLPPEAPPASYLARLDAVAEDNPDDDYSQGPGVAFEAPPPPAAAPRPFPWWIVAAAAVVVLLLIVGAVAFTVLRGDPPPDTTPGRELIVPDVTGLQGEPAREMLETFCGAPQPCFDVRVTRILIGGIPPERFTVGRTDPPPGSRLKQGSQIVVNLTVRP